MPRAGRWWAVYWTAERAKFMLGNHIAMSSSGELQTEMFSNWQAAYYLKQAQQCCGS
jgi:hypothetical protein